MQAINIKPETNIAIPDDPFVYCELLASRLDADLLRDLLGPGYEDMTKITNSEDPLTFDEFWIHEGEGRVVADTPAVYVFSWWDNGKIYGVILDTLCQMLESGSNPLGESLSLEDRDRAGQLLTVYRSVVPIFPNLKLPGEHEELLRMRFLNLLLAFHPNLYETVDGNWLFKVAQPRNMCRALARHVGDGRDIPDTIRDQYTRIIEMLENTVQVDDCSLLWDALQSMAPYIPELSPFD